jgi:hypothetical protein
VQAFLKESYRQVRHEDDLNQPLSVQPWGHDGDKRRYWLVEGREDTEFRLYREAKVKSANPTWWSVAGNIDELKTLGERLKEEGSQAGKRLSEKIDLAIPRLEMALEVGFSFGFLFGVVLEPHRFSLPLIEMPLPLSLSFTGKTLIFFRTLTELNSDLFLLEISTET